MSKKVIFSEDQVKDILDRYSKCESATEIGKTYNVGNKPIYRVLKENCIKITNRKHFYNEDYFKKIDSAEKAYWIGFIAADGYINEDRGFLRIKLQESDLEHLKKFISAIGGDEGMIKYEYHNLTGNKQYYAEVNGRHFVNSLVNLNLRQAKSSGKERVSPIPKRFIRDYIRGLVDGDGHIENKRMDLISSVEVLAFVQEYLSKKCYTNTNKILKHCNTHRIYICKNIKIVLKHLYYKDCVSLDRKNTFVKQLLE